MAVSSATCFISTHSASPRRRALPGSISSPSQLKPTAFVPPQFLVQTQKRSLGSRGGSRGGSRLRLTVLCARESRATVVTKDTWEKSILKSDTRVLVEFYASWCGPCRMMHRIIEEIAGEYAGRLGCFVLNTDKDMSVTEDYEIKAVPVVLLFKNGEKQESIIGTMPKEFYIAAIERVVS